MRALTFDGDNRIWAGAADEVGWFSREADGWSYHSLHTFLPPEHQDFGGIWYVFKERDGVLFVADGKILRWNGTSFEVWPLPGERPLRGYRVGNSIYVQDFLGELYVMTPTGPLSVIPASKLAGIRIRLLEARGEGWFAVTNDGIYMIDRERATLLMGELNEYLKKFPSNRVIRIADSRLAIATDGGGLVLAHDDGSIDEIISAPQGLPATAVTGIFSDRDGQLWITSFDHIARLNPQFASSLYDARANLPPKLYQSLAVHQGALYAGTHETTYYLGEDQKTFTEVAAPRRRASELRSTPQGLLIASAQAVYRMTDTSTDTLYTTLQTTYATLPMADGSILVSEGRQITRYRDGQTQLVVVDIPDLVVSLALDRKGTLWLGTYQKGIYVADIDDNRSGVTAQRWLAVDDPENVGPTIIQTGTDGEIHVFGSNGGWIVKDRSSPPEAIGNYPRRTIAGATEKTTNGSAWLIFEGTTNVKPVVGRVSKKESQWIWEPHSISGLDQVGLPQSICIQNTPGGDVLWIGGSMGLLSHAVATGPIAPQPAAPIVSALVRDERNARPKALGNTLPYSTGTLIFEFAAPEFDRRSMLKIETRVDGIDEDWNPAGADARQELSALRDGSYLFRARVIAETGQISEETRLAFTVLPPWWRTQGALIGVVLGLVASGYGAYRLRMQALRRRNAELEEKVRRRTRELEAANAAKTQFVANMSHDIRNPLNGIQGMTLALEDMDPTPRQAQAIATLRECATYLTSLVDDVLDFAHIEAGKVELRPRAFVPGELLRSVAATLQADAAAGGARLSIEVGPGLPERLMGDAGRIQQILVNYGSNALKYAGGHIRLSAAARTGATGEVEFAVHDDGPGIDLEEQATLFTKFTRLARDRATEIPGSGLGLASCRLLADLMGGAVGVMSQPGAGARFFLRLPIAVATEADATPAFALPNTTVLLVEDTDYNAQAAAAVLARLGLTCERARTGTEALAMFRQKRFNLVLLDRNLPDMDGTEVARQMRATESDGLPAILLAVTAYCTAEDRRLCLEAGMDAFVGKPLTPEKLRRVLLTASRRLLGTASVEAADQRPGFRNPTGFDLSMLTLLADDAERMEDQIDRYLETLDDYARALADAANDPATLVTAAHRLVGHARLIAATALGTAARELEDAARAGQAEDIETLSERTLKEVRATTAALRLYRSPAPSA